MKGSKIINMEAEKNTKETSIKSDTDTDEVDIYIK